MNEFDGSWELTQYCHVNDEFRLTDGELAAGDADSWLLGLPNADQRTVSSAGLQLAIEGTLFTETASDFSELMFDREGIQVNDYSPMSGKIISIKNVGFLLPQGVPEHALPPIRNDVAARYDDGDTVVCDTLRLSDRNLLRQVSVITDELYIDRMVLVYQTLNR